MEHLVPDLPAKRSRLSKNSLLEDALRVLQPLTSAVKGLPVAGTVLESIKSVLMEQNDYECPLIAVGQYLQMRVKGGIQRTWG